MTEPILFGFPITLLFLYFMGYSFLGWIMETTYCSIGERRFVARGFLYGPICPIYGVGVLMMICWFAPFTGNPILFYAIAVICMSAWEYLVGWFLETTTHIKYWDYSMHKLNLHGRICLWVSLTWGVLAYLVIFWIHPPVARLIDKIPPLAQHIVALVLLVLLVADAAATIRDLALVTRMLGKLNQMGEELQLQLALGKSELSDRLDEARDTLTDRLEDVRDSITERLEGARDSISGTLTAVKAAQDAIDSVPGPTPDAETENAAVSAMRQRYNELLAKAERQSRHLRHAYSGMTSKRLSDALTQVPDASRRSRAEREAKKAERRAAKKNQ